MAPPTAAEPFPKMAMVPLGCSRKCVSPFPVPRHSFPTERHRHIPEGLCFILRGAGHGKGAGWTRKMSCREGVCRLAKPGWAALAGGEGFPEEVLAGRLTVPLWELCKPPQHCPLLLQLALLLHIQGGCLTPHIHTVQQACHHLQDDVLADCTPFLWAESRESESWKARPRRCQDSEYANILHGFPSHSPAASQSHWELFPLAEPCWSSRSCGCRGHCCLPSLSSSASWTLMCHDRAGKELLPSKFELLWRPSLRH